MIETIRSGSRKFYRCSTCSTLFNELGETYEHSCRPDIKINNRQPKHQGESDGFRTTSQTPFKRSYNIERATERSFRVDGYKRS
jgi:hypothetical protein